MPCCATCAEGHHSYIGMLFCFQVKSQVPLKIFFQQHVEINHSLNVLHSSNGSDGSHKMITSLLGHPHYLPNSAIISNLPSTQRVDCSSTLWQGLITCKWDGSGMLPILNTWTAGVVMKRWYISKTFSSISIENN